MRVKTSLPSTTIKKVYEGGRQRSKNGPEEMEKEKVEALCRECGHGFKVFVDRVVGKDDQKSALAETIPCPVCGCGSWCVIQNPIGS